MGREIPDQRKILEGQLERSVADVQVLSEIRKLIYTTNAIENFNRQLRKVTKTKSAFVSDDAL
jgi:transposase-like protein